MGFRELLTAGDRASQRLLGGSDSIVYAPTIGPAKTVQGIFDAAYQLVDAGQPGISSSTPAVFLTLADLPSDPEVDVPITLTINGLVYKVFEVKKDGVGGMVLMLHRV